MCAGQAGDATFATEFRGRICSPQLRALHGTCALRKRLFDGDDYYAFRQDAIERKTLQQRRLDADACATINAQALMYAGDQKQ